MTRARELADFARGLPLGNVTPFEFGAAGDGVTDDTAALQAWAAYPALVKRGTGTFLVNGECEVTLDYSVFDLSGMTFITSTEGNFSPFRVSASGVSFQRGRIRGPYRGTDGPYPTAASAFVDGQGNGAIRSVTTFDNRYVGLSVTGTEIDGWGDYAVFAENVDDLYISQCHIHHNGYNGVRTYGAVNAQVVQCHIHHIFGAPGIGATPNFNAYGVTFTRRAAVPATGDPLIVHPPSDKCAAKNNHVHDIPTWKALDTHGGKSCTFDGNYGFNNYIAIGVDEADTSGTDNCPFEDVLICNNVFTKGVTAEGSPNRPVAVSLFGQNTNRGRGFTIHSNTLFGYGGSSRAQISVGNAIGGKIFSNHFYDSQNAGINFLSGNFGEAEVYDNTFYGLGGAIVAAIAVQSVTAKVKIGLNRHIPADTSTYKGVLIVTQNAGYFVDLDHQEADDPATLLYDASAFGRTRGGNIRTLPFRGAGSPEGVLAALPGMTYINTSGGAGATFWVKESSGGTTGWVAK